MKKTAIRNDTIQKENTMIMRENNLLREKEFHDKQCELYDKKNYSTKKAEREKFCSKRISREKVACPAGMITENKKTVGMT